MVRWELWYEINSRFKLREPNKSIARSLELSVQKVRRILKGEILQGYSRESFKETVLASTDGTTIAYLYSW
jgi:hypothetical protein